MTLFLSTTSLGCSGQSHPHTLLAYVPVRHFRVKAFIPPARARCPVAVDTDDDSQSIALDDTTTIEL